MANTQNLISLADRTTEEQREIARKGGIASGKVRRLAKTFKEAIDDTVTEKDLELMIKAMIRRAKSGDTKAFEVIRDTRGEKPKGELGITTDTPIIIRGENELKD